MPLIEVSFNESEEQLMKLLHDGMPHCSKEIKVALGDGEMSDGTMRVSISYLRKKLPGHVITTETVRGHDYCLYRLRSLTELVNQIK
jgi:hypothetical protein